MWNRHLILVTCAVILAASPIRALADSWLGSDGRLDPSDLEAVLSRLEGAPAIAKQVRAYRANTRGNLLRDFELCTGQPGQTERLAKQAVIFPRSFADYSAHGPNGPSPIPQSYVGNYYADRVQSYSSYRLRKSGMRLDLALFQGSPGKICLGPELNFDQATVGLAHELIHYSDQSAAWKSLDAIRRVMGQSNVQNQNYDSLENQIVRSELMYHGSELEAYVTQAVVQRQLGIADSQLTQGGSLATFSEWTRAPLSSILDSISIVTAQSPNASQREDLIDAVITHFPDYLSTSAKSLRDDLATMTSPRIASPLSAPGKAISEINELLTRQDNLSAAYISELKTLKSTLELEVQFIELLKKKALAAGKLFY